VGDFWTNFTGRRGQDGKGQARLDNARRDHRAGIETAQRAVTIGEERAAMNVWAGRPFGVPNDGRNIFFVFIHAPAA